VRTALRFFLLLLPCMLLAQTEEQPLYLEITFPQHSDTINADQIRISGYTDPEARLAINGKRLNLYPQGSFVARVSLQEKMNKIIITSHKADETVQDILFIYRTPVPKSFTAEPTRIDPMLIEPEQDIWLQPGDFLHVMFKASPGGLARFSVEKIGKNLPMVELAPEKANGLRGVYKGVVRIHDAPENQPLDISFEIQGVDGKKRKARARGKVYLLPQTIPLVGYVQKESFIHGSAQRYLPIGRALKGTNVHIIGRSGKRYKIDLVNKAGYIDVKEVSLAPWGSPLPRATIGAPQIDWNADWLHLTLPIDKALPFFVEQAEQPLRLQLQIIGAQQSSHWITYPNGYNEISSLELQQIDENIFELDLTLEQEHNWGYRCYYTDKALHFLVRRRPVINPDNPVENLVIAIDAGHGGEETGAVSPLGVLEKDINMQWGLALVEILRRHGARPMLTRENDETVPLQERIMRAEKANALLLISLHNNGVTPQGNAAAVSGTSTYFTLPQNKGLSWAIYPRMVALGLEPYGRIYNSYFITRATGFLTTLVEGGFLTHPKEEIRLSDPVFIQTMANAVYDGLGDFLRSRAE